VIFDRFIAIDWSGARPPGYRGVAVAECGADGRLRLVPPPEGALWRRTSVLTWLSREVADGGPALIGFDFAFALPFDEDEGFLPGSGRRLSTPADLWRFVDELCAHQPDLYAGAVVEDPALAPLFWQQGKRPDGFVECHRLTETVCRQVGWGAPQSVFKLIGAAQVGKGSLAGMRLLHRLRQSSRVSIWPFVEPVLGTSVCVEIYPGLFMARADRRGKLRHEDGLRDVVRRLEADPGGLPPWPLDDHCCDALVSAAALRYYAGHDGLWQPEAMTAAARQNEGWIFGLA
jgi:hypothetical protein